MSAWRRAALEQFPERQAFIRAGGSIYDFLSALECDLRATYSGERNDPALADRAFAFVAWCFNPRQNRALRNAAAVGFYEHLPNHPAGRRDIATRLSFDVLCELDSLFRQMLPAEDYEALADEVTRAHGRRATAPPFPQAT